MKMADVVRIGEPGKIKGVKEAWIKIPGILAWPLGLVDRSEVFFYLIESTHYAPDTGMHPKKSVEYQLIATPIDPDIWEDLYNIEFKLGDEPGSLAAVASILGDLGISAQIGESRTYLVNVRAECNATVYFKNFHGSVEELNEEFEKKIEHFPDFRKKIKPLKTDETRNGKKIWIAGMESPLNTLHIRGKKVFDPGIAEIEGTDIRVNLRWDDKRRRCRRMNEHCILPIPKKIIDLVDKSFDLEEGTSVIGSTAIIVADTNLKGLWITFVRPSANVASVEFYCKDEPGVLASVSRFLGDKGVNLLETRMSTVSFTKTCLWRVIADFGNYYPRTRLALQRKLRRDMRDVDGLQIDLTDIGKRSPVHVVASFTEASQEEIRSIGHERLDRLENALRDLIEDAYKERFGEEWWKEKIPGGIKERIEERSEDEESPMQHCYFTDYAQIILSKIGRRIFPNRITLPDDIKEWDSLSKLQYIALRLKELEPIRNFVAHNREITEDQFNKLEMYTQEILNAIRKEGE